MTTPAQSDETIFNLRSVPELTSLRVSKSSKDNLRRVLVGGIYDFAAYARRHGGYEPQNVSMRSPLLILNYLAEVTNLNKLGAHRNMVQKGEASSGGRGSPELKSIDTLNGYVVQGLSQLFEKHGHIGRFSYDPVTGRAAGNPIESDGTGLQKFRRRYRALLAELGQTDPKQASPLGIDELLALHAEIDRLKTPENIQMYAACLLGTNLILRFDEVTKLRMEYVTLQRSTPKIKIILSEKCKNTTYRREYICEPWGGRISGCLKLDTSFALLSWILIRDDSPGYLFCGIQGNRMNFEKPLQSGTFVTWLQNSLLKQGIGQESVKKGLDCTA